MKAIIAGGRDFIGNKKHINFLDAVFREYEINTVVTGGARGADEFGYQYARHNGVSVFVFNADWDKYGRGAGPIRNEQMAALADMYILFPGSRGTYDMKCRASNHRLKIIEYKE